MLSFVMAAYRASKHEGSHYTPSNFLMFGREVDMPMDLAIGVPTEEKPTDANMYGHELLE